MLGVGETRPQARHAPVTRLDLDELLRNGATHGGSAALGREIEGAASIERELGMAQRLGIDERLRVLGQPIGVIGGDGAVTLGDRWVR